MQVHLQIARHGAVAAGVPVIADGVQDGLSGFRHLVSAQALLGVTSRDVPDHLCRLWLPLAWRRVRFRRYHTQCAGDPGSEPGFGTGGPGGATHDQPAYHMTRPVATQYYKP